MKAIKNKNFETLIYLRLEIEIKKEIPFFLNLQLTKKKKR